MAGRSVVVVVVVVVVFVVVAVVVVVGTKARAQSPRRRQLPKRHRDLQARPGDQTGAGALPSARMLLLSPLCSDLIPE